MLKRIFTSEVGNQSVSIVILAPILLVIIGAFFVGGRYATASNTVTSAANAAARDASLARDPATARSAGEKAAARVLAQEGTECASTQVRVDTSGFSAALGQPASVRATVVCTVSNAKMIVPGIPGAKTFTKSGSSPIDEYRERP
jgi:Flp pilus assembly protein TadG